jgi:glycosyltransferase involved in cell wall biosynthesis
MIAISVVTVNLNNHLGLKNTIESVLVQTFSNYEILIIDGGSCDNSLQIIITI